MIKIQYKLRLLLISIALLLTLMSISEPAYAQWPPFWFSLTASYENGQITYQLEFEDQVDWTMTDVMIKVPLPEGTRFLEASAIPAIDTSFDGAEVTFFIPVLSRGIKDGDALFVVEVTDPTMTVITTHTWITWQGNQPGDYLTKDVSVDITQQPLNWEAPPRSHLQLEASAAVANDIITFFIYPKNVWRRMWDVKINVPVPEGTTFLSAEAPAPFVVNFDGREVSFFVAELERQTEIAPLSFRVSTEEVIAPFVTTHAWATWKNVGRDVGKRVVIQEETVTGDIVVQPHTLQWFVADTARDVPLFNYDITGVALQEALLPGDELALKIIFYSAEELEPAGDSLEYRLYIDSDCYSGTGKWQRPLGVEHLVVYQHPKGYASIKLWNAEERHWDWIKRVQVNNPVGEKRIIIWVPYNLLENGRQFCWIAEARNTTKAFNPPPPTDRVTNSGDLRLTQYEVVAAATEIDIEAEIFAAKLERSEGTFIDIGDTWQYLPGWSDPSPSWKTANFDDSDWFSGATKIGYGDGKFTTDLSHAISSFQNEDVSILVQRVDRQSGMIVAMLPSGEDVNSIFMRGTFTIADLSLLTQLALEIEYEGGFIAYLNEVEVARRGLDEITEIISYDALADDQETGISNEVLDLSSYIPNLISGTNVLAIQAHRTSGSSNLSISPKLTWKSDPMDITPLNGSNNSVSPPSVPSFPSVITNIRGKLAIPIDNGQTAYDIYVFSLPDGREIARIPNARQPNFRFDGQRMLINREGGGVENVYEYDLVDGTEKQVSDAPQDWYPFYNPRGNRVVYGNSELTVGADGLRHPFIFVQCGLLPPHQEAEQRCLDIPRFGILVPAGQMGEIQGTHPVWTSNDMIAYKGCNSWAGFAACGIYIVPPSSTKGFSDGFIPRQLTKYPSDIPSDTKDNLIAFTSYRDGNWEAYVMDLNGAGVKNVSNSPKSNDGLPTVSPDGNWIAFVSDRNNQWAIWAAPVAGGPAQKLFDLPVDIPWGEGNRAWTNERISWGP